jgi:hypothetical protein
LLIVFKNFLDDSTNSFKWAEITLNKNKTIFISLYFYFSFHIRPRNLLPDHVYSTCWRHCCWELWMLFMLIWLRIGVYIRETRRWQLFTYTTIKNWVNSKGFWRWCITIGITELLDFV